MQRSICITWLLIGCFSVTAFGYSGGSGDPNDPYQIATAQDLIDLGNESNDYEKHFILTADVNLAGHVFDRAVIASTASFGRISVFGDLFSGSFDGQGYVIHNLQIAGDGPLGLFGYADANAAIVSVGLMNVDVNSNRSYGGALVGYNMGTITSSYSTGKVSGTNSVGGLVGKNKGGTITSSFSTGEVSGRENVGGLVGESYDGTITLSYSTGEVRGKYNNVGGLVGKNSGAITSSNSTGKVTGRSQVGGLVGVNDFGTITWSYSTGEVIAHCNETTSSYNKEVGGLVGKNNGMITSSHSTGTVAGYGLNRWPGGSQWRFFYSPWRKVHDHLML